MRYTIDTTNGGDGDGLLLCYTEEACIYSNVTVNNNKTFHIDCGAGMEQDGINNYNGYKSCANMTIFVMDKSTLNINCRSQYGCSGLVVECLSGSNCNINCGFKNDSCQNIEMECFGDSTICNINNTDTIHRYQICDENDINLLTNSSCFTEPESFMLSCDDKVDECNCDETNYCNKYQVTSIPTLAPTMSPTPIPITTTSSPTSIPTVSPSESPSNSPTFAPALFLPTPKPTPPTYFCNTANSCSYPEIKELISTDSR
jgi:hypothetical protein